VQDVSAKGSALVFHWKGGCVGPRTSLKAEEKIKISSPCLKPKPVSSVVHVVDYSLQQLS
jgi:hypothetical protein